MSINIKDMITDENIEAQEIIEKFGADCPSHHGLEDDTDGCYNTGDNCNDCWLKAIEKRREYD